MPEWLHLDNTLVTLKSHVPTLAIALAVLVGGWLVAFIAQKVVYAILIRTELDNKLTKKLGMKPDGFLGDRLERLTARTVYYVLLGLVLIAFFSVLKVEAVTRPLEAVLVEIGGAIPNILKALFLAVAGYIVASVVRRLLILVLDAAGFDKRVARFDDDGKVEVAEPKGKDKAKKDEVVRTPSRTIAGVAYWFILVVFAIPVLEALEIGALAKPLSTAFERIAVYLPRVGGAIVLMLVGYILARVARAVVAGLLSRLGLDKAITRLGVGKAMRGLTLSGMAGTLVMAFILLQFAISAIGKLEIDEISGPAGRILEMVYGYLPKLVVGGAVMAVGVVLARVTGNVAGRLVAALGFNSLMTYIGVTKEPTEEAKKQEADAKAAIEAVRSEGSAAEANDGGAVRALLDDSAGVRTPADVVGLAVSTVVVLFFLRQVLLTLHLEALSHMVDDLIGFLPEIFVACAVVGASLWAGRWVKARLDEVTRRSEDRIARATGTVARVVIVAFGAMLALQQLGVGQQLILVTFALVFGAICLAAALAFGLGGREVAARIVGKEYERRSLLTPPSRGPTSGGTPQSGGEPPPPTRPDSPSAL